MKMFAVMFSVFAVWFFVTGLVNYIEKNNSKLTFLKFSFSQACAVVAAWMWGLS